MKKANCILLVDDISEYLDDYEILMPESTEIVRATTAKEAMKLFEQKSFDLCVIDVRLDESVSEDREGLDLLKGFKEIQSSIPVIIVSAYQEFEFEVEALGLGAAYFIRKPIVPCEFEKAVIETLELEKS